MLYLKSYLSCLVGLWRELVVQLPSYHELDNLFCSQLFCRLRGNPGAVAHDRNLIGNAQDFCHLMGNVDDAAALIPEHIDNLKEVLYLLLRQG